MHRILVLLTVLTLACGSDPANTTQQPPPSSSPSGPNVIPTAVLSGPICFGDAQIKFDDATQFVVEDTKFPLTLKGEFRGCPDRVMGYYDFAPINGSPTPHMGVPVESDGDGNWSYTFDSPPGLGLLSFHVLAQDENNVVDKALWVFWIKDKGSL